MAVYSIWESQFPPEASAAGRAVTERIWRDMQAYEGYVGHELLADLDDPGHLLVVSRWDTAPRMPFGDASHARQALAEDGVVIAGLTQGHLPSLARLADAVSELADGLARRRPPASRAVGIVNELAAGCTGTLRLVITGHRLQSAQSWHDPDPVAGLARRVIEEFGDIDLSRLRQCQRKECDLLFFDTTRSRSQRWHAESPCGWLERQHRRRAT